MTKGPLEISAFFEYLLAKGIMSRETYLASLEFGNEVASGTGTVQFREYSLRVW